MRAREAVVQSPVRQEAELFRHILDALPYPIFWKGRDLRYLGCNAAFARLAGMAEPGAVVGLSDYELPWRTEDSDFYRACDKQVLASGQPLPECEESVRGSDAPRRWTQTSKVPLRDEQGAVFGVLGILIDVTERREAQERFQVALTAGGGGQSHAEGAGGRARVHAARPGPERAAAAHGGAWRADDPLGAGHARHLHLRSVLQAGRGAAGKAHAPGDAEGAGGGGGG